MSNDRGVFTLGAYRRAQVEGQGVDLNDVWLTPEYGVSYSYFAGGYVYDGGYTYYTIVDKLQFSSDSVARSPSADLDFDSYARNPVASSTAAYWMSGKKDPNVPGPSSWTSKTSKTTFSTDTTAASPNYPTPGGVGWLEQGSTATETTGYIGGGNRTPGVITTQLQKLTFATDAFSNAPSFPQYQRHTGDALGNQTYGYWSGGTQVPASTPSGNTGHGAHTIIARFTYSTDTHSNVGTIPAGRKLVAASGNANEGYIYGGLDGHPAPANENVSTIIKITYATDTSSLNPSNLIEHPATGKRGSGNTSNGYVVGAGNPSTNSNIFKFNYSTGTQSNPGSLKSSFSSSGVANASSQSYGKDKYPIERWTDGFKEDDLKAGYYQGGGNPSYHSATQKIDFITDQTSIVPGGSLPENGSAFAGVNSNSIKTIISGGSPSGENFIKFVYSTETSSNLGSMPGRRWLNNDMGYGTESVGYVTGGMSEPSNPGFYHSDTQKIEYATDTASEVPGANSNQPLREMGAFGNIDHTIGYFVGGITKSPTYAVSRIQKMTYSTETVANTPANMQNNYFNLGTTTGPDAGYIYSKQEYPGYDANGAVEKFVYATDSRTSVPQPSYYPSYGANGTGNSTNGYYGGGSGGPTNRFTRIHKLNFSTGILQQIPSSFSLPSGVYRSAASSSQARKKSPKGAPVPTPTPKTYLDYGSTISDNGYLGGGYTPGNSGAPVAYKVNMTTETISTPGGIPAYYQTVNGKAISSPANAYFAGGPAPTGPAGGRGVNTVKKISYATDSQSAAPSMSKGVQQSSAFGTNTAGYIVGGINTDYTPYDWTSFMQKITYSTESWSTSVYPAGGMGQQANWHLPRPRIATGGNTTHGYMGPSSGGYSAYKSNIVRYSYATDVSDTLPGYDQDGGWESGHRQTGLNSLTDWYIAGGELSPVGQVSSVAKMSFATDTVTNNVLNMNSISGEFISGLDNPEKGFGLLHRLSLANKITFSTDTSSNAGYSVPNNASPGGTYAQGGTSQKDFGQNVAYSNFIL